MTGKERADKFIDDMLNCSYEKKRPIRVEEWAAQLGEYFQSAILVEREECAKICERRADAITSDNPRSIGARMEARSMAAVIRARSQSAPQPSNQPQESPKISFAGHQPD